MSEIPLYVAHTPPDDQPDKWQGMREHTGNVAKMAAGYARVFGAQEMAKWAGWLHDAGKYSDDFQEYLRNCDVAKKEGRSAPKAGSAEHKIAGTRLALSVLPQNLREMISACVLGHHGGLVAVSRMTGMIAASHSKALAQDKAIAIAYTDFAELNSALPSQLPAAAGKSPVEWEMFIRFLFSCLVDADSLDTEQHFNPETASLRQTYTLDEIGPQWLKVLTTSQNKLQDDAEKTRVNEVRREVYEACLTAADLPPGLFSLTVPTGGGKTRSSLAFALKHALAHAQSRIIYAIPYTSIIDQTAAEFRKVLGEDGVLEHHSAIEDRSERREAGVNNQSENAREQQRKLDAENWNAPLIVTTTVQLFESLFSNQTSRCRKVHHIAGSIIVLDEVQTLPAHLLLPLLDGLKTLIAHYGVTVVLCTATQPALAGGTPFLDTAKGLGKPTLIVAEALMQEHFRNLKRVTYQVEADPWNWTQVAEEIKLRSGSCLAILNTKNDALALLGAMDDPNTRHLSTLLCGEHRRHVLAEVKAGLTAARMGDGPPVWLISTQVIEAGVDIDFPSVVRARGPLDRIIQAAGRCNREGTLGRLGNVLVFNPAEGKSPPGNYRTALEEAWIMITDGDVDFDDPALATEFFTRFYSTLGMAGLDQPKAVYIEGRWDKESVQESRAYLDFPLVARKMRLIDDDTTPVLVPYHNGRFPEASRSQEEYAAFVARIEERQSEGKGLGRDFWKRIQSFTVAVRTQSLATLPVYPAYNSEAPESIYVWRGIYDPIVGIGDLVDWDSSDLIVG